MKIQLTIIFVTSMQMGLSSQHLVGVTGTAELWLWLHHSGVMVLHNYCKKLY